MYLVPQKARVTRRHWRACIQITTGPEPLSPPLSAQKYLSKIILKFHYTLVTLKKERKEKQNQGILTSQRNSHRTVVNKNHNVQQWFFFFFLRYQVIRSSYRKSNFRLTIDNVLLIFIDKKICKKERFVHFQNIKSINFNMIHKVYQNKTIASNNFMLFKKKNFHYFPKKVSTTTRRCFGSQEQNSI